MSSTRASIVSLLLLSLAMTGCRISSNKSGDDNNVRVATPFGSMQVKTNEAAAQASIGLPIYPGAQLIRKDDKSHDHDSGAADVNMSFGSFQLHVKALSFQSSDSPDKVKAFYRKALGRYGVILECAEQKPVSKPDRTPEGLTCDDRHTGLVYVHTEKDKTEFKAGSEKHQHIVSVEPDGAGTKFGLVALDLPGHISIDSTEPQPEQ